MASESERIRQLMDLLEGTTQPMVLNEGWVDRIASAFNGKSMGQQERAKMAKELTKEWHKWLGQTDRTGDLEDMVRFMKMRVGFNDSDVQIVFDRAGLSGESTDVQDDQVDDQPDGKSEVEPEKADDETSEQPGYDPEEGVPLPKDLNAKLSDYKDVDKPAKPAENVVRENPRAYLLPNGDFDRVKARNRLKKLPKGSVLKIGNRSLRLTAGDDETKFFDGKESISEAPGDQGEVLSSKTVKEIMDYVAAQVNDQYLLNGPERDMDGAAHGARGRQTRPNYRAGNDAAAEPKADDQSSNDRGAGRYDSKMMKNILKVELELSDSAQSAIAQKVKQQDYNGMARMTESDMDVLARIGYAFLKAK